MKQESQRVAGEVEAATYDDGLASVRGGCRGHVDWVQLSCGVRATWRNNAVVHP